MWPKWEQSGHRNPKVGEECEQSGNKVGTRTAKWDKNGNKVGTRIPKWDKNGNKNKNGNKVGTRTYMDSCFFLGVLVPTLFPLVPTLFLLLFHLNSCFHFSHLVSILISL